MSRASYLKYLYFAYFLKPQGERFLHRRIRRGKMARLVEIGVGNAERAKRLIQTALRFASNDVHYTGIDMFEASDAASGAVPLIQVHRELANTGAKVRLIPGETSNAITNAANSLPHTDLLVFSASISDDALVGAWFFLPRMLHPGSLVLREHLDENDESRYEIIPLNRIQEMANQYAHRRAA